MHAIIDTSLIYKYLYEFLKERLEAFGNRYKDLFGQFRGTEETNGSPFDWKKRLQEQREEAQLVEARIRDELAELRTKLRPPDFQQHEERSKERGRSEK